MKKQTSKHQIDNLSEQMVDHNEESGEDDTAIVSSSPDKHALHKRIKSNTLTESLNQIIVCDQQDPYLGADDKEPLNFMQKRQSQ